MKFLLSLTAIGLAIATVDRLALAHGSSLRVESVAAVEITATYDSREPMQQAQVTIYSPANLDEPWQTGQTDNAGQYRFIPDQDGQWEVKVRQAGHGMVQQIPVEREPTPETPATPTTSATPVTPVPVTSSTPTTPDYTPLQQAVMVVSVLWGCVGTALFFRRQST